MADLSIVTATGAAARALRSVVFVNKDVGYFFYIDNAVDFVYKKTTDGGRTWGTAVTVQGTETMLSFDVWYDRWTPGDTGTKIHIWYVGTGADDIIYKNLDTQTDTLSSGVTIFNGLSATATSATPFVSGTKARSGYLFCIYDMDAGAETGFYRSTDGGTNWSSRTNPIEATRDVAILFPGNETDSNDIWMLYQDADTDELTLKVHDDSANTNSESSAIGGALGLIENATDLTGQYGFSGSIRHSDGHLISAHFTEYDTGTADFRVFDINGTGSITELTAIATNKDDMYHPSVFIDQTNNDLYVAYIGKSDGLETLGTTASVYYARSTDDGTTWSVDNVYSATGSDWRQTWTPLMGERFMVMWMDISSSALMTNYADYSLVLSSSKRWQVKPYLPVIDSRTSLGRGLVFSLPISEGGGTTTYNVGSLRANATLVSSPTWQNSPYGKSLSFNGSSSYLNLGTMGSFWGSLESTNITVSFLFKTTSTSIASLIGFVNTGTATFYQLAVNANQAESNVVGAIMLSTRDEGGLSTTGGVNKNTGITNGDWHHIVATVKFSGNTITIFLDGVKQTITYQTTTSPTNFANAGFNVTVGARNLRGVIDRYLNGEIANVNIWNRVLTDQEAVQLYSDPWSIYKTPTMSLGKSAGGVTTTQTITGISRITKTVSQTILGKADILKTTLQTILGKSRITKVVAQTIQGLSRITKTVAQTILGKSRITATTTRTITGKGDIRKTVNQTIQGISNIATNALQTILGKSRITATTQRTITGKGDILKTTTRTIQGLSRVTKTVAQTILGISRITKSVSQTILGKSRITANTLRTILGLSRITKVVGQTILGKSRITKTVGQTIQGITRVTKSVARTIQGLSRITKTVAQTILGKSRITDVVGQVITGVASISVGGVTTQNRTILGLSRILVTVTQNILGRARIGLITARTILGRARITVSVSRTIKGKASISSNIVNRPSLIVVDDRLAYRLTDLYYIGI